MKPVTKDDLLKYVPLKREIENRMEYLARMKTHEFYPEAKETDGSQHTGTASDANAKAIEHRLEYEESIAPIIAQSRAEVERIERAVAALENPMEREIIRLRYLDPQFCRLPRWNDISIRIYGDDEEKYIRACARIHRLALQNLESLS